MNRLHARLAALEQETLAPDRIAAECRTRTRAMVERLHELHATEDAGPQYSLADAEIIALHDRVRVAFGLPPIGELP